jgi:hypothetical protein
VAKVRVEIDSREVLRWFRAGERKGLLHAGALMARSVRTQLRYAPTGQSAAAGASPLVHRVTGNLRSPRGRVFSQPVSPLRELTTFAYDASTRSVVVGPVPYGKERAAPRLHEFGGTISRVRRVLVRKGGARSKAQAAAYRRKVLDGAIQPQADQFRQITQTATYPKRPWLRPALNAVLGKQDLLKGFVRGG